MKFSKWPILKKWFCKKCGAFGTLRRVDSYAQIGTLNTSTLHGNRKLKRHELVYRCKSCGSEERRIAYL